MLCKVEIEPHKYLGIDFDPWSFTRPERLGIALAVFKDMNVPVILGCEIGSILDFILEIEFCYKDVPYHSFCHGLDVLVKTHFMLNQMGMANYLTSYDITALLLCALCHDVGHPGLNNLYQLNAKTELSKIYPRSTLEAYSVDLTIGFIDKHDIFRNTVGVFDSIYIDSTVDYSDVQTALLSEIQSAILLTDMSRHFEVVDMCNELVEKLSKKAFSLNTYSIGSIDQKIDSKLSQDTINDDSKVLTKDNSLSETFEKLLRNENSTTLKTNDKKQTDFERKPRPQSMMKCDVILNSLSRRNLVTVLLHAVDIFNPVLPWNMSKKWSTLMMEESLHQGDLEKNSGLQVSPSMDREKYDQCSMSIEFSQIIIFPFFKSLSNLVPVQDSVLFDLNQNILTWTEMKDKKEKEMKQLSSLNPELEKNSISNVSIVVSPSQGAHDKPNGHKLYEQTRRLSVAAGTIEISPGHYNVHRRHSDDTFENISQKKVGLFFSKKLNRIQTRRKINKVCHLQPSNKSTQHRNEKNMLFNNGSIRSSEIGVFFGDVLDKDDARPTLRRAQSENLGCRCVYCKSSFEIKNFTDHESTSYIGDDIIKSDIFCSNLTPNKVKNRISIHNSDIGIHKSISSNSSITVNSPNYKDLNSSDDKDFYNFEF
ncbi:3',5'-cyclic-nucleotide phosphodiesterase regA [Smittium culicis]|uniref:Phosphodiesterase n=1 Tax=Smittium culicis TaxID=133412 RepID=A0A1R1YDH2_9FUNG|nr:3',5'-cyclic-nucleotide phosphodiesterase regA [Smittium culicis]